MRRQAVTGALKGSAAEPDIAPGPDAPEGLPAVVVTAGVVCVFAGLWFVLPLARRSRVPS